VYVEQFVVEGLGHQSYLVGSDRTRETRTAPRAAA
jgi:hypothetical protein